MTDNIEKMKEGVTRAYRLMRAATDPEDKAEKNRHYHRLYYLMRCAINPNYPNDVNARRKEAYRQERDAVLKKRGEQREAYNRLHPVRLEISSEKPLMIENDNENKHTSNRLTKRQNFQIIQVIQAHGSGYVAGDDEIWVYEDGWNDERVAKETGFTPSAVKGTRATCFGRVRIPSVKAEGGSKLKLKVAELEMSVVTLKAQVATLEIKLATSTNDLRFASYDRAINMLIDALAHGRNSVDPRKLQELQQHFNNHRP